MITDDSLASLKSTAIIYSYGAGFYVDATTERYKKNFKMFSYVTSELVNLVNLNFPVLPEKQSIFGHSMGT